MVQVIPYNMVCRQLPGFKPSKAAFISRIIKQNNGRALGVVHPWWCKTHWFKSSTLRLKHNAFQQTSSEAYASYLKRLEYRVSKEKSAVFLFTHNERLALKWAFASKARAHFILITTKRTPIPCFPKYKNERSKWETLGKTLMGLGVEEMEFAGELDCETLGHASMDSKITRKKAGCVNIVCDNLTDFITIKKLRSLTFPGNYLDPYGNMLIEG
jgi:hypothetical protein